MSRCRFREMLLKRGNERYGARGGVSAIKEKHENNIRDPLSFTMSTARKYGQYGCAPLRPKGVP